MKLQELAATKPSKKIAEAIESYFGPGIKFDKLTPRQTKTMLAKVRGVLGEHRQTTSRHFSETNPSYLKLLMVEQALSSRLKETTVPVPGAAAPATGAAPAAGQPKPAVQGAIAKDPKLAAALKKSQAGQTLNPEEQKLVAGAAMMQAESRLRRAMKRLNESEVQQAQVVLAAQDMVDKMQGMLEDVSELQFKELPALVDSIKNQVGIDQAQQFNQDASAALSGLMQNLQAAKQQLDQALGVVTGQAAPMSAGQIGADIGADVGADMGAVASDLEQAAPAPEAEPAEPAGGAALGRARR